MVRVCRGLASSRAASLPITPAATTVCRVPVGGQGGRGRRREGGVQVSEQMAGGECDSRGAGFRAEGRGELEECDGRKGPKMRSFSNVFIITNVYHVSDTLKCQIL